MNDLNQKKDANGAKSLLSVSEFERERWAQLNPWLLEGQPDDRIPMDGSVKDAGETPSVQRAFARKSHQAMFKKWSQERND